MSQVVKNIVALLASQVATWCITLIVLIIIPDRLGDDGFGVFSYVVGYVSLFMLIAGLGSSTFISRAVARDHSLMGSYVYNAVAMKVVLSTLLSVVAVGLALVIGNRDETLLLIALGCVGMYFYTANEVFSGALAGLQRMARPAMWQTVQVYVSSFIGLLVVAVLGWGVIAYSSVMTFSVLIPFAAGALMVRPYIHRDDRRFDAGIWRVMVRGGVPLMALSVFNMIYGTVDVPILHALTGDRTVGWYGVAMRWISLPVFAATTIGAAYFPVFSSHAVNRRDEFAPTVNRTIKLVMLITTPAAFGLGAVADDLIGFFYRDHQFDESIVLMQILAVFIPLGAMDTILAGALIAADRTRRYLYVAAAASVLNPIAVVVAINITDEAYGNGAIGAAIVTVATEAFIMAGALALRSPGVVDRATAWYLARVAMAATIMVGVVLVADVGLFPRVAIGAAVYGIASFALRTIESSDVQRVRALVTRVLMRSRPHDVADVDIEGGQHGADTTDTSDLSSDLHAEPGGQDRLRGAERAGQ